MAVDALLDDAWSDQAGVPVVSDRLTPAAMTETVAGILGFDVELTTVTTEQFEATMIDHGASEGWARGMANMVTAQNDGAYETEPSGAPPASRTGFRDWCREVLAPAVKS